MKKIIVLALFLNLVNAGIFDVKKAKKAFEDENFTKAAKIYSNISGDKALYNKGVSLYKDGNFTEALRAFGGVTDPNLEFEKLYNLGNSFANLGRFDEAKFSYESALKIKDDEDAKFNLDIVTKELEKEKKGEESDPGKKDDKTEDKRKDGYSDNNQSDQNERRDDTKGQKSQNEYKEDDNKSSNQYSGSQNQEKDKNKKDSAQIKKENSSDISQASNEEADKLKADENETKKDLNDKQNSSDLPLDESVKDIDQNSDPISDMELKKWQKILKDRELSTRMLELKRQGDPNDEDLKPW
ncbi:tetratricopeptide repeat protein [Campylobacter corcagiensis]|uniref:Tetratricopeptide repeat protein n=1 Tax=Campylobacter corcagiensis TaxID=1448857 RepID=A0A7M1LFR9_9BACT|nr:tetratricopeptide repeat protein [Campylobacter corcagiensis]QKF64416.1 tetratricopeptide repeat protein [Campylobacter corcagiensis]QOQ87398.1 tetratricopeptide repeat protein [Campylobacter corcagiensis]